MSSATRPETFITRLQRLLRSGDGLPTLPTVVFEIHALVQSDDADVGRICRLIEQDPALTAGLLRTANAAANAGPGGRIASVQAAVQRLGLNRVWGLCLVASVVQAFEGRARGLDHDLFWRHSAAVGQVARLLWRSLGASAGSPTADEVYVAGLLHDVGLLALDQFFPDELERLLVLRASDEKPIWPVEEAMLGMDHGEIGGLLLGAWALPAAIVDAVTFHHRSSGAPEGARLACLAVQAADAICAEAGVGLMVEGVSTVGAEVPLAALGFGMDVVPTLHDELLQEARGSVSVGAG